MSRLSCLFLALFISSCLTTPGIPEPIILYWVVMDDGTAVCQPTDLCHEPPRRFDDLVGHRCVSPHMTAEINSHHEALHEDLNKYHHEAHE